MVIRFVHRKIHQVQKKNPKVKRHQVKKVHAEATCHAAGRAFRGYGSRLRPRSRVFAPCAPLQSLARFLSAVDHYRMDYRNLLMPYKTTNYEFAIILAISNTARFSESLSFFTFFKSWESMSASSESNSSGSSLSIKQS